MTLAAAVLLALAPAAAPVEVAVARALAGTPAGGPRAAAATRPLHGLPYREDALGEGVPPDADPRFRLDAFDCMTFAETAVALGSAASLQEARAALDDVRYQGEPALSGRHHEVLSQWIPANLARGWIRPASRAAAGDAAVVVRITYDEARWRRLARLGRGLRGLAPAASPAGRFQVEVVPPAALPAAAPRIAEGTLAFVVREDRDDRPSLVTHVGLVVAGPGGARLVRHATSTAGVRRVVEESLARYLAREEKASRRPLLGLALFEIADARARLAARLRGGDPPGGRAAAPLRGPARSRDGAPRLPVP